MYFKTVKSKPVFSLHTSYVKELPGQDSLAALQLRTASFTQCQSSPHSFVSCPLCSRTALTSIFHTITLTPESPSIQFHQVKQLV